MSNITLILSGIIVSLFGISIFMRHLKNINMIDVYVFSLCQYYGILSFIDGISNDYSSYDTNYIIFIHFLVIVSVLILTLIRKIYKKRIFVYLDIKQLNKLVQKVPIKTSRKFLIGTVVLLYIVKKYIIGSYIPSDEIDLDTLQIYMKDAPYWITSISMLIQPLFILAFIISFLNLYLNKIKWHSQIDITLFLINIFLLKDQGRTTIVIILLLLVPIVIGNITNNYLTVKILCIALLSFFILIIYSNIHQTYRNGTNEDIPFVKAMTNFEASLENIQKDRMTMWHFNYLVMEKKWLNNSNSYLPGQISLKILSAAIPTFIYGSSEKPIGDYVISEKFKLFGTDYPSNDITTLFADFDIFVILALPIKLLLIACIFRYIYIITSTKQPLITIFYFILYFTNIMSIEAELLGFAILFKNTLIYGLFLFSILKFSNIFSLKKYR